MASGIKKPPLSLKKKLMIRIIIVSILVCAIILLIILPEIKKIGDIREVITQQQQSIEKEHEQSKKLKQTLAELDRGLRVANQIAQATVGQGEELRIITQFEDLSESLSLNQQLSVDKKTVEPGSALRPQGIQEYYLLNISNTGKYEDLVRFIEEVERLPFFVAIESMTWQTAPEREGVPMVSLRFQGKVFIYEQPQ